MITSISNRFQKYSFKCGNDLDTELMFLLIRGRSKVLALVPADICHANLCDVNISTADQQLQSRNDVSESNPASSPAGANVIDPLPALQRRGLIAVSTLASISLVTTFLLLLFLTNRFIFWRRYYRRYFGYNQYVVLVYNLALADLLMSLGFLVSLRWITTNSLHASDAFCFIQGTWLQIGNPMSGMFVLAIALYTFLHVIMGYQLSRRVFLIAVVSLWVFGVVIVIIPIAAVGRYVWLPAVAWVS